MKGLRFARSGVATTLAVVLMGAAGAAAQVAVKGDAQAWSEIKAAWSKLPKLKSYRVKITSKDYSATMPVVTPDRFQVVVTYEGTQLESVTVGEEIRFREGNGPWQCGPPQGITGAIAGAITPANFSMFDRADVEMTVSRGPAATVDGVQAQSYTFTVKEMGAVDRKRVYIDTASGLPKRMETLNEMGAVKDTTTFFDYNANISITLPPCR